MKYVFLLLALWGGYNFYNSNAERAATESRIAASFEEPIVLFGTQRCGYCKAARKLFKETNTAFLDVDIDKSEEGAKQFRELKGNGVPLFLINGKRIAGFDETSLRSEIANAKQRTRERS